MHKIDFLCSKKGAELNTGKLVKASTCMGPAVQVTVWNIRQGGTMELTCSLTLTDRPTS
jgi:hypothetical protein